jgi:hypothetical protein
MYSSPMQDDLARFVDSLVIPAERKRIVLAELTDHVACAIEAALREGRDPDAAARAALGDLETLRRALEAVEPAFQVTRWRALGRGLVAGVLVAVVVDQAGAILQGVVAAVVAVVIAALFAPPRALHLLRAELRAPYISGVFGLRGVPIGPAATYLYAVLSAPFLVWIGLIVGRGFAGDTALDTPWSAFAVATAMCAVLLVEGVRARRAKVV